PPRRIDGSEFVGESRPASQACATRTEMDAGPRRSVDARSRRDGPTHGRRARFPGRAVASAAESTVVSAVEPRLPRPRTGPANRTDAIGGEPRHVRGLLGFRQGTADTTA